MLDIPEMLIVALTLLLGVLLTRHWIHHGRNEQTKK
jgi:hypothetical protein